MSLVNGYLLIIEAEWWPSEEWVPTDTNTDVWVTFDDGSRWVATFFTYANITRLTQKYHQTGECLSGVYFWTSDMILIDEASRPRIEEVVYHLIQDGTFERVFTYSPSDNPANDDEAT